ncbi:lipase 3-like [Drosophila miranda]|uniref:lipase 3-like n=1 Tax=Drosophila miranda TaxID=7229 RepID=UPI0007E7FFF1|nr:lipase 3-like [Drosophila miranda]
MTQILLRWIVLVVNILGGLALMDTGDYIRMHNYPVEKHTAVTQDGYILALYRIPNSPRRPSTSGPKPAVLFVHGMTCSSDYWVIIGPDQGLPFLLADEGYDVWLINSRGNTYSRKHLTISPNSEDFWQFDWHEIGIYDTTTSIDFILSMTGQTAVHYVGHSQGATSFLAMLSMRPEYNIKVKTSHLLGPVAFSGKMPSKLYKAINTFYLQLGDMELMYNTPFWSRIFSSLCTVLLLRHTLCRNMAFLISGGSSRHLNMTLLPAMAATASAGISTRQIKHYAQLIDSGRFALYDFGKRENLAIYGTTDPPDYPLNEVNPLSPIDFYYSDNDGMAAVEDVLLTIHSLPNARGHRHQLSDWGHIDYVFGNNLKFYVNNDIVNIANAFESRLSEANQHHR